MIRFSLSIFTTLALTAFTANACAQGTTATTAASAQTTTSKKWPDPTRFEKTIAAFENTTETIPANPIIAYGSSSIRGWHKTIKEDLAPLPIVPRGFGGSNMNDALHFMDRVVTPLKPSAVLLYEGDNDVAGNYPYDEIVDKYKEFVTRMHKVLPSAHIYILSVKPSPLRWKMWPTMQKLNGELKKLADADPLVTYIDIATPMLQADGNPRPDIYLKDNLHMNAAGYEIWTKAVKPVLIKDQSAKK